ncbi:MAG: condensation domain-containing protein, partial [Acidobacteriota bacterium]
MPNQIIGYRLSPQQKRVWSLQQDGSSYVARCAILLDGTLNVSFLEKALETVIKRHQILRTTLQCPSEINIPIQVITDSSRVLWREVDLTGLDAQAQEAAVEKLFEEEHLNLEQGPLRHALLLVLSTRRHFLLLSLPTVCADAWTLKNLVPEISLAYTACAEGRELTDEPLQYVQFSEWQNELVADEDAEEGKEYWRQQLIPELLSSSLPFESKTQRQRVFESHALSLAFPAETVAAIDSLALRHGTTAEAFLLACWQTLLWRLTGQREIVVGTAFESRPYEELHDALGLFARWLPINAAFDKHISFREVLKRARESMLNASNWQDYFSWDLLAQNDAIGFFPFGFEYAKVAEKYQSASLAFSIYKQDVTVERFKVKLCCTEGKGVLHVELQYDAKLYEAAAMQRLAGEYQRLSESALGHPEVEISKLAWLGEIEERELRCEWNQISAAMPASCLNQLFEAQVERCAEAVAVVFEE